MNNNVPQEEKPTNITDSSEKIAENYDRSYGQKQKDDHKRSIKQIETGAIGKIFGDNNHITSNIVGATILCCFILIVAVLVIEYKGKGDKTDLNSILLFLTSIMSLAFGYIFGNNNK